MHVYFVRRFYFFPVLSLFKDQVTFLIKQKWVVFQQGPKLALSMNVNKMLQKNEKLLQRCS